MCRHLAYVGPPVTVADLVVDPPHSLLDQSYAPADMRGGGTVNADGFGVGFWPAGPVGALSACSSQPCPDTGTHAHVYKRDDPMWTDASFLSVAPTWRTHALVAAVRSATVGMPVSTAACAPFAGEADGAGWLFSHNGVVRGWPHTMAELAETLPALDLLTLDAATDSALLWALVRAHLRAGKDAATALTAVVADVLAAAPGSRLNLLLGDGETIVATAVDHALAARASPDGSVTVASEPLDDDPAWRAVDDGSLVTARAGPAPSITVNRLDR